jgi:hypothetical protein
LAEGKADPEKLSIYTFLADYLICSQSVSFAAAVVGGSHGGFIAGNLIGLSHPTLKFKVYVELIFKECVLRFQQFQACVMRNPVTDIPAMAATTDIPDWYC